MNATGLKCDWLSTPIGTLRLQFDEHGLHSVDIGASRPRGNAEHTTVNPYRSAFERYFDGELDALDALPVVMDGTTFQRSVWQALRSIAPGSTVSYAQLADKVGNPRASRAVGSANGRNPLPIIVPCHRVISADGTLGGFSAGLKAKRWLLQHEGASVKLKA